MDNNSETNYLQESINTIKASRFEIFLAKVFGKKIVAIDDGWTMTVHRFRGVSYLTGFDKGE